jgi:DNA-directed RNA polymerase subunit RPC12/RpoP
VLAPVAQEALMEKFIHDENWKLFASNLQKQRTKTNVSSFTILSLSTRRKTASGSAKTSPIDPRQPCLHRKMPRFEIATLIYRCPRTGMNVPLPFALKAANKQKAQEYEQVRCPACTYLHLISRATGKLLSDQKL